MRRTHRPNRPDPERSFSPARGMLRTVTCPVRFTGRWSTTGAPVRTAGVRRASRAVAAPRAPRPPVSPCPAVHPNPAAAARIRPGTSAEATQLRRRRLPHRGRTVAGPDADVAPGEARPPRGREPGPPAAADAAPRPAAGIRPIPAGHPAGRTDPRAAAPDRRSASPPLPAAGRIGRPQGTGARSGTGCGLAALRSAQGRLDPGRHARGRRTGRPSTGRNAARRRPCDRWPSTGLDAGTPAATDAAGPGWLRTTGRTDGLRPGWHRRPGRRTRVAAPRLRRPEPGPGRHREPAGAAGPPLPVAPSGQLCTAVPAVPSTPAVRVSARPAAHRETAPGARGGPRACAFGPGRPDP